MLFAPEMNLDPQWQEVRIGTQGVDDELAEDLLAELSQTRLRIERREGEIIVVKSSRDDVLNIRAFTGGVFPDLVVRGFTVQVSNLSL